LQTGEAPQKSPSATKNTSNPFETRNAQMPSNFNATNSSLNVTSDRDADRWNFNGESPQPGAALDDFNFGSVPLGINHLDNSFTWEMIGLGLEEPLPPQDTIDEL
jgi:hypothetical protein